VIHSDSLNELIPALIAAQEEFPPIPRDGYNPHFKSRFSSLKAVQHATRPVLARHNLAMTQWPSTVDGKPALTTWLAHSSGQFLCDTTVLSLAKSDPQAQGSGITYLRRYAWSSILGLVTDEDDDDGARASRPAQPAADAAPPAPSVSDLVRSEFMRLVEASKRAGVSRADVERNFAKKYGRPLAMDDSLVAQIGKYADELTREAIKAEMSAVVVAE